MLMLGSDQAGILYKVVPFLLRQSVPASTSVQRSHFTDSRSLHLISLARTSSPSLL
jgi:hypothetical protein